MHTKLVLLTDHSGSMNPHAAAAMAGVNKFVADQAEGPGTATISHWNLGLPGGPGAFYTDRVLNRGSVPRMTEWKTPGNTPLRDAVVASIEAEGRTGCEGRSTVKVLMVATDGQDYGSIISESAFREKMSLFRSQGWKILFMGAGENYVQDAIRSGFDEELCFTYDVHNMAEGFDRASKYTSRARGPVM